MWWLLSSRWLPAARSLAYHGRPHMQVRVLPARTASAQARQPRPRLHKCGRGALVLQAPAPLGQLHGRPSPPRPRPQQCLLAAGARWARWRRRACGRAHCARLGDPGRPRCWSWLPAWAARAASSCSWTPVRSCWEGTPLGPVIMALSWVLEAGNSLIRESGLASEYCETGSPDLARTSRYNVRTSEHDRHLGRDVAMVTPSCDINAWCL